MSEYTNIFHTLCSNLGIEDYERILVLKYRSGLHRYIQTKMDFLDISSLGFSYRYAVKIERNSRSRVSGKSMDRARKANLKRDSLRCMERRVTRSIRKTLESGESSTIALGTTLMNVAQYSHWCSSSKTKI
jgi:hypothetical protein